MGHGGVDFDEIMDAARAQGMTIERTQQNHYRVRRADGKGSTIHCSRSEDSHARMNIIRDLKRIGFVWPPPKVKGEARGASAKDEVCCVKCFNIGGACRAPGCECHVPQLTRLDAILAAQSGAPTPAVPKVSPTPSTPSQGASPNKQNDEPMPPAVRQLEHAAPAPAGDMQALAKELVECKTAYQLQSEHEAVLLKKLKELEREVAEAAAAKAKAWAQLASTRRRFDELLLHDVEVPPDAAEPR